MSQFRQVAAFAAGLYRQRADIAYAGYLRRDPMALLVLRPGRVDPYAIYDRLRRGGPLTPTRLGNWLSTSHPVCDSVLRDRRFGVRPEDDGQPAEPDALDLSFLGMNPPDHARLRRLAMPAFGPKAVAGYADRIERVAGDLLDAASVADRFDLVSGFAAPLPIAVITDLLGIPDSRSVDFARHGMVLGSALDGIRSLRHAGQLMASDAELNRLFEHLFELRRREPRDDIVSRLVAAEGDQITPAEMLPMCSLLLVAGFETTVNLISNAVSFSPPNGEIRVRAREDGRAVLITVEDDGPGIPPEKLTTIFDRFYTERPATEKFGTHSGLGLSISKQIVEAHRGRIWAENRRDGAGTVCGARFLIRLPEA